MKLRGDWESAKLHKYYKRAKLSRMDSNDRNVFIPKRLASGVLCHNTAPRASFGRPINKFVPLRLDCWLQSHHNSSVGY